MFIAVKLILDKFPNWTKELSERFPYPIKFTKASKTRRLANLTTTQVLSNSEFLAGKIWTLRRLPHMIKFITTAKIAQSTIQKRGAGAQPASIAILCKHSTMQPSSAKMHKLARPARLSLPNYL